MWWSVSVQHGSGAGGWWDLAARLGDWVTCPSQGSLRSRCAHWSSLPFWDMMASPCGQRGSENQVCHQVPSWAPCSERGACPELPFISGSQPRCSRCNIECMVCAALVDHEAQPHPPMPWAQRTPRRGWSMGAQPMGGLSWGSGGSSVRKTVPSHCYLILYFLNLKSWEGIIYSAISIILYKSKCKFLNSTFRKILRLMRVHPKIITPGPKSMGKKIEQPFPCTCCPPVSQ